MHLLALHRAGSFVPCPCPLPFTPHMAHYTLTMFAPCPTPHRLSLLAVASTMTHWSALPGMTSAAFPKLHLPRRWRRAMPLLFRLLGITTPR